MTRKEAVMKMLDGERVSGKHSKSGYMYFRKNDGFKYYCNILKQENPIYSALEQEDGYQVVTGDVETDRGFEKTKISIDGEVLYRKVKK